jgi:hypothetical protein
MKPVVEADDGGGDAPRPGEPVPQQGGGDVPAAGDHLVRDAGRAPEAQDGGVPLVQAELAHAGAPAVLPVGDAGVGQLGQQERQVAVAVPAEAQQGVPGGRFPGEGDAVDGDGAEVAVDQHVGQAGLVQGGDVLRGEGREGEHDQAVRAVLGGQPGERLGDLPRRGLEDDVLQLEALFGRAGEDAGQDGAEEGGAEHLRGDVEGDQSGVQQGPAALGQQPGPDAGPEAQLLGGAAHAVLGALGDVRGAGQGAGGDALAHPGGGGDVQQPHPPPAAAHGRGARRRLRRRIGRRTGCGLRDRFGGVAGGRLG